MVGHDVEEDLPADRDRRPSVRLASVLLCHSPMSALGIHSKTWVCLDGEYAAEDDSRDCPPFLENDIPDFSEGEPGKVPSQRAALEARHDVRDERSGLTDRQPHHERNGLGHCALQQFTAWHDAVSRR